MKTFRLVVALRLAIFPLIFNLTFAQEVEVVSEEMEQISTTPLYQEGQESQEIGEENTSLIKDGDVYHASMDEVVEDLQKLESDTPMDFSSMPRNDNEDAQDSPNEDLELEIPPTPLIKGGNPELAPLAEDGGITLTEEEQETPQ